MLEELFEKYLLKKSKEHDHPDGTYVSAHLGTNDKEDLFKWVKENKIPNPTEPMDYHATISYSRKGVPDVVHHDFKLPMVAKIVGWHVFPTQTGGKCLVAALESKDLTNAHNSVIDEHGATHSFPEYHPHITVSYDYNSDVAPKTFPNMQVKFTKVKIEPLDPEFKPKKA